MKLLGVVILYYPGDEVKENILSYINDVDQLIIWENTPLSHRRKLIFDSSIEQKILRTDIGRNEGIGLPLNEAVRYGRDHGFTHLLSMDQDSYFDVGEMGKYKKIITETMSGSIGCYGAAYRENDITEKIKDSDSNITSGSIFPLEVFGKAGLFREDFFIDGIDNEYCYRLRLHGYRVVCVYSVFMHHTLGYAVTVPFLWGKLFLLNYSPMRTYYIVRNHIVVQRLYRDYKPLYFVRDQIVFRIIGIIFKETNKWKKLHALAMGLLHGALNRTGKYKFAQ